jgi:Tol biopolymer transport system component
MTTVSPSRLAVPVLAALLTVVLPTGAAAQYFGQNKVQYETFNFQVIQTEHFDVYYYPEEREAALLAARMAERWYARLTQMLGHELGSRQPLIMYANHPHFEQTNVTFAGGEATGGVTEALKRRIVLPFAAGLEETDHVIGHEIVHAFQFDITGQGRTMSQGGYPGALNMPLWFIEGMAEYLSVGAVDPNTAMWMRDAVRHKLPTLSQLDDYYTWFPYRFGQALWAHLAGRYGDEVVGRLLKNSGRDLQVTLSRMLGGTVDELSEAWHRQLRESYEPLYALTDTSVAAYGRRVFAEGNVMDVAPTISPDGRRLAFISSRDFYSVSIDVFIGDLETGEIIRKITKTLVDPHFESLQFINSAGAWSPDGARFALAGIADGRPIISLIDVESGERDRDIRFPQLGEIYTPAWSPDGRLMAFSAIQGGLSDIFLYDLETDDLRRLTNDPFADLHPAWSPDGRRLAFSSDRFTTNLDLLDYGHTQIVMLDMASGEVRAMPGFDQGKHNNPQWSADGQNLFFVSDRNGISNVYRLHVESGALSQVTNLYTGVSGITPTSPALTVAQQADRMVIATHVKGETQLQLIDDPEVLRGREVLPAFAGLDPARLPPPEPITDQVATLQADMRTGLPDTAEFVSRQYSAGLGLDFVSQPTLLFASDQYGTYIGAGAQLWWSDMLANRRLVTGLEVAGSFKDITALVGYINQRRRLNWGVFAQQLPYRNRFYTAGAVDDPDLGPIFVEQILTFRQTNRDISGQISYPLSRPQRIEFSLGFRDVRFEQEIRQIITDFNTGEQVDEFDSSVTSFPGVTMATASAALVYDQSLFGATSPVLGQRYRLEAAPVVGSISYVNLLADYRRYLMPVRPFTLAARLVHLGRYGGGSEDLRLQPLFIGYPGMIRGYTDGSFEPRDCAPSADESCPLFSRLIGSRMILANAEVRFPLLGLVGVGSGYYGALPVELAFFADAGLAWSSNDPSTPVTDERPWFAGGDRRPVTSVGASLRINALNYAVIELSLSRPLQRDRWIWQFGFVPGF